MWQAQRAAFRGAVDNFGIRIADSPYPRWCGLRSYPRRARVWDNLCVPLFYWSTFQITKPKSI